MGHKKTLSPPYTNSVRAIPIIKVLRQNFMLPPAEGKDTECGQEELGGYWQGSSTFLRKELWFFVMTSLIWGDIYHRGSLVKSNGFKVKDFGVQVLLLIRAMGPKASH